MHDSYTGLIIKNVEVFDFWTDWMVDSKTSRRIVHTDHEKGSEFPNKTQYFFSLGFFKIFSRIGIF